MNARLLNLSMETASPKNVREQFRALLNASIPVELTDVEWRVADTMSLVVTSRHFSSRSTHTSDRAPLPPIG